MRFAAAAACLAIGGLLALAPAGPAPQAQQAQQAERPPGWSAQSHGDAAAPDYARLFSMERVHELRIRIAPTDFLAMQQDLATLGPAGLRGFGRAGAAFPQPVPAELSAPLRALAEQLAAAFGASPEPCAGLEANAACSIDGAPGQCRAVPGADLICLPERPVALPDAPAIRGRIGGLAPQLVVRDPIFVPVTVTHDGRTWSSVGMRFKGNSSLMAAAGSGTGKIPFRLDFDRYEDEAPATRNQRFYGFEKLTFSSNYSDDSMLREVLATEAFRDQGVPAARAAFYRVFVDTGNGDEYWGLYSMIEDPADGAMLHAQFGDDGGNLYKPEGPGSNWSFFDEAGFGKKTNESEGDFADVAAAVAALHAPREDAAAWRAGLESQLDVDGFLTWLAVNSLIANWDSYGRMAHNYYLYGDPDDGGRLHWIPWDHNMSFAAGRLAGVRNAVGRPGGPPGPAPGGAAPGGPAAGGAAASPPGAIPGMVVLQAVAGFGPMSAGADLLHRQVNEASWPLIARILSDDVYAARYRQALEQALEGFIAAENFDARVRELHAMIAPHVVGPDGERPTHTTLNSPTAFERSADALITMMAAQRDAARTALTSPP